MLRARIDRFKEESLLVLGKLAAVSTPQLGVIYGFANRREARELSGRVAPVRRVA